MVSTNGCWELLPTATCPKETLAGLVPRPTRLTPVPRTANVVVEFAALLVKVIVPGIQPAAVGEKVTFSGTLCPAGTVSGKLAPGAENGPLPLIAETVILVWPLLVKATTAVSLWPTTTLPKRILDGPHVSCCVAAHPDTGSVAAKRPIAMLEKTRVGKA